MKYSTEELIALEKKHCLQVYKRYPLAIKKGKGSYVWDMENNKYIDALAGIAVNCLGHSHPKVVKAVRKQAQQLIHISNFYLSQPMVELAAELTKISGMDKVFFANSGAEAVEGAIKLARKYSHGKGKGGTIISMEGCFHGRTLATIATGKAQYQEGFEPIPEGFKKIPFNDIEAAQKAVGKDTAAFLVEAVQGEGGINLIDQSFLAGLRALCNENDVLLIMDEVQSGMGRTGKFFAYEHFNGEPDIVSLAKGLGGGLPIGAVAMKEKVADAIAYGEHGTTFGGNPLACAGALATLEALMNEKIMEQANEKGKLLMDKLIEASKTEAAIKNVRGLGLMIGVELDFDGRPVVERMFQKGVLSNVTAGNVIRLVPPLNISVSDLHKISDVLIESIKESKRNE